VPIKHPSSSLAIAAAEDMEKFLDKAASTLILMTPAYPQNYASTEDFDKHSHESPSTVHTK
jgi:hypothetical protein